ncbi:tRNA epoxyqueuosine(34) reductase QueG [Methylocella silvestris]|uniref:Epoxyqueuosine reductase n=1 Tax=Methylocella silvestris TaxID=199596 RepID=A0A2J7TMQ4_METSI|nr:tRNA epoxyqueuosine(34) reductase QueG [Methylocella silvestris]PNG28040.1 tRNA epoxyqueuosine(34) reductase QueG [Methylocella silvestris]
MNERLAARLEAKAKELGFDVLKITQPSVGGAGARLAEWIEAGFAGEMDWMAETAERRADPALIFPQARSAIMLGVNYGPAANPLAGLAQKSAGNLSVYARNRDYHDLIKGRLKQLAGFLSAAARAAGLEAPQIKVFVDTAPVMEKPLAQAAGLGWQGKHTNLVSREFGSWLFLGSIFTSLELPADQPERDHCGNCSACLDICPTQAFPAPHVLDARRCISYLTIEHKGHIAPEFREKIGNRIYGCDDCLAVCPWNKFAQDAREIRLQPRDDMSAPPLAKLLRLNEAAFRDLFSGSPVKRIGFARFMRNVLIAAGNSGAPELGPEALRHLDAASPLMRAMAVWALSRLAPDLLADHNALAARETDVGARREWAAAQNAPDIEKGRLS